MQIALTDLDGALDITLGDDAAGDVIVDPPLMPKEARAAQIRPLAFAPRVFAKGRGNRSTSFNWTVARSHEDEATAAAFSREHAADVPINASMQIDGVDAYSRLVIVDVECIELYGTATTFRYSADGATPA